jgi:hypothetical protein
MTVYDWFAEGLGMRDLQEAKALLGSENSHYLECKWIAVAYPGRGFNQGQKIYIVPKLDESWPRCVRTSIQRGGRC